MLLIFKAMFAYRIHCIKIARLYSVYIFLHNTVIKSHFLFSFHSTASAESHIMFLKHYFVIESLLYKLNTRKERDKSKTKFKPKESSALKLTIGF